MQQVPTIRSVELGLLFRTWLLGERVGEDELGNRYYRRKAAAKGLRPNNNRSRRWVVYGGEKEASRVPPGWHAWLHHISDEVPNPTPLYDWKKPPRANLSGTAAAWYRRGSLLNEGRRGGATGDYRAWRPNEDR